MKELDKILKKLKYGMCIGRNVFCPKLNENYINPYVVMVSDLEDFKKQITIDLKKEIFKIVDKRMKVLESRKYTDDFLTELSQIHNNDLDLRISELEEIKKAIGEIGV